MLVDTVLKTIETVLFNTMPKAGRKPHSGEWLAVHYYYNPQVVVVDLFGVHSVLMKRRSTTKRSTT